MATKRSVILKGSPVISEEGVASGEVRPGYLVKGVSTIAHQTVSGSKTVAALALERDELGKGIDNTYQSYAGSAYYASGDRVKVGVFAPGMEATVFVASGQDIQEDELLSSAGDGTFASEGTASDAIARAMETLGAVTELTPLRVQFI